MGAIAYYVQWVVYIAYLVYGFTGTLQLNVLMNVFLSPTDLIHTIGAVNQEGAWGFGVAHYYDTRLGSAYKNTPVGRAVTHK